ncbi:MAG TPA: methyltransferase domain-containing protein [Candidatus Limnocylindria bacterium]|nr:methyltransferase domain-containing protein [Candidatus Limnocylindria bacterium]
MATEPAEEAGARLARYYDLDMADETADLDLYLALATATGGPILELAAGSGRIAGALAAAGHAVTGVDRDLAMLARAARLAPAVELVEADITTVRLDRRFGLVVLALNGLLLVGDRPAQRATLDTIAAHLAADGRAVIDAWLPPADELAAYDGRLTLDWLRQDAQSGELVGKVTSARYDQATAVVRLVTIFESCPGPAGPVTRSVREDELQLLAASELLAMVERAGLEPVTVAGDYSLEPLGEGSERVLLVCGLR